MDIDEGGPSNSSNGNKENSSNQARAHAIKIAKFEQYIELWNHDRVKDKSWETC